MRRLLLSTVLLSVMAGGCRTGDKSAVDTAGLGEGTPETQDADGDGYAAAEDCDDSNALVSPGAVEVCDGIDNDCDGTADEDVTTTFYADTDADGFGDEGTPTESCEVPEGFVAVGNDCDDADADSYPGAAERCDDLDNDCDGVVDEDVQTTWYADADADGHGDLDSAYAVCDPPPGYVSSSDDCDDTNAAALPGGVEVCDEVDNDCDGSTDEGVTTTFYQDTDGDNYGVASVTTEACSEPTGYAPEPGDCDDTARAISPAAAEVCDTLDNDCDGTVDEEDAVDAAIWYGDGDGDGYGAAATTTRACTAPSGYVSNDDDCDDGEAAASPGEAEVCDEIDNDCDGDTDEPSATDVLTWYADGDGDGYGSTVSTRSCSLPSGFAALGGDCDDGEAAANPGEAEVCDEIDNDCDGDTDESLTSAYYLDFDGDGYGGSAYSVEACSAPRGYVGNADDCNDASAASLPGGTEVCDAVDNDCDGVTDEADAVDASTFYADGDGDGYGDSSDTAPGCTAPSGYVENSADCDDTEVDIHPDAPEACNGEDDDCDGDEDNGVLGSGEDCPGESCLDILDEGSSSGDGLYSVEGASAGVIEVYCDMSSDGGGWTLVGSVVNDGSRNWDSYTVWTDDTTFGSITDRQAGDFKSDAYYDIGGDDVLFVTEEYAFSFEGLLLGDDFATFLTSEYDTSTCSTTFLKSGADWSDGLTTAQAALQSFVVRPYDDNAACFPTTNENAIIGVQLASCCWTPGLGNTPAGQADWSDHDLSLLQLSYLNPTTCTAGSYPCNDNGYYNPYSYNCYDESCKLTYAEVYVR